jgi:hypothetical protein
MAKNKATLAELGCTDAEGYKKEKQGIYESTMPSARWAPWTSSSTRTSRSFLSRATKPRLAGHDAMPATLHGLNQKIEWALRLAFSLSPALLRTRCPEATVQASRSSSPASSLL